MFSSLTVSIIAFTISAAVIVIAGSRLAKVADELADRTGLGEALFGIFLLAMVSPRALLWGVHPITPIITIAYLFGLHLVRSTDTRPMWFPRLTRQTVPDQPETRNPGNLAKSWLSFIMLAAITGIAGWGGLCLPAPANPARWQSGSRQRRDWRSPHGAAINLPPACQSAVSATPSLSSGSRVQSEPPDNQGW